MGPSDPGPLAGVLADGRWSGAHGIGRFATEVLSRLPEAEVLRAGPPPLHPLDTAWTTWTVRRRRPTAYFSPGFNPPFRTGVPLVFTLCDLIHVRIPEESGALRRLYYAAVVRPAARRAHRVLTISESSRRDVADWAGIAPERVENVGCGVSPAFRPEGDRVAGEGPYLLFVGNRKPHKNVGRMLEAFSRLRGREELRLMLSGPPDAPTAERLRRLGIERRVGFLGSASDEVLAAWYRGAVALVQPSILEGFGLPVAEALACRTPVLAARAGALPEVAGDAAVYFDPLDADSISEGMERLLSDGALRSRLAAAGPERARGFTWERTASRVRAVLEDAVRSAGVR
jgi:glycosyltransferase involved in cell wall biosynthesis